MSRRACVRTYARLTCSSCGRHAKWRRARAGNDLARCLNWGGGLYVLRDRGLPAMLHDVEHATVSLLDRWDVQIAQKQPELSSAAQQLQRMSSLVARDKPEAEQVLLQPTSRLLLIMSFPCAWSVAWHSSGTEQVPQALLMKSLHSAIGRHNSGRE